MGSLLGERSTSIHIPTNGKFGRIIIFKYVPFGKGYVI